ncbi:MAG: class I tRNA ligase family protein, partial [Endomicrobiales bacterium]
YYENLDFYRVIGELQRLIDTANRHIEATAPWKMAREKNPDLPGVIFDLLQSLGVIALYILPFMPHTSQQIWEQIGESGPVEEAAARFMQDRKKEPSPSFPHPGNQTQKTGILFPRIVTK